MRRNGDGLRWRMLALLLLLLLRRARSCMVRSEGGEGARREEGTNVVSGRPGGERARGKRTGELDAACDASAKCLCILVFVEAEPEHPGLSGS